MIQNAGIYLIPSCSHFDVMLGAPEKPVSLDHGEEQVNGFKTHQITKAAKFYLSRYGQPQPPARFDVVAIVWPTGRDPIIRHTPDAFEATF